MGPDHDARGFGARRGWRAPKGGAKPRREAPSRATSADVATDDPAVASLARLAGLGEQDAARLAEERLPAPGAPDAITGALAALGRLIGALRRDLDGERRRADLAEQRRAHDAERHRDRLERARTTESRHRAKAADEQGQRQRLVGELERARGELAQLRAERDQLAASVEAPTHPDARDDERRDAVDAGLHARIADLERQLVDRGEALDALTGRAEAAEAEAARLLALARRLRLRAIQAGADVDLVDPDDVAPLLIDDLPDVRTCGEAVELAAAHARHVVYTERAFETARSAPYDEPRKLLRDLVALDRVAAAWDAPGGTGRPIRDVARDQGLEWADDVSVTARSQHPREYVFSHAGRQLWAGPHVKVATGRGMRRTCRVYLALVKGDEPDLAGLPRGVYVGPVGKHLSDSTTG